MSLTRNNRTNRMSHMRRHATCVCILAVFLIAASAGAMETAGTLIDVRQWGNTDRDSGLDVCALPDDGYFMTGWFENTFTCSDLSFTAPHPFSLRDVFLARFNANGTLAWVTSGGSSHCDVASSVDALSDGTSFIVGSYGTGGSNAAFGTVGGTYVSLPASDSYGVYFAKYNPDGTLQWARWAGGSGYDSGNDAALAPDGSCYATGLFSNQASFGPTGGTPARITLVAESGESYSNFLVRYSSDGILSWAKTGAFNSVAVLSDGSCVVTRSDGLYIEGHSPEGSSLWSDSPLSSGELAVDVCAIRGTRDFLAIVSSSASTSLRRYHVATDNSLSLVWESVLANYSITYSYVRCRTNGDSIVYNYSTGQLWGVDAAGSLVSSGTTQSGANGIAYLQNANECILIGGFYSALTFGTGQPGEVTLTPWGSGDMYEARVKALTLYELNTDVDGIGGCVLLTPSGGKYPSGTVVSVRAAPAFPNHTEFLGWEGEGIFDGNTNPSLSVTIEDQDIYATAFFDEIVGADPLPIDPTTALVAMTAAFVLLSTRRLKK